jgi:Asp-tRNA(Asn)/Glu-tRNA(Gln) amidotransferase A subunit family amidase
VWEEDKTPVKVTWGMISCDPSIRMSQSFASVGTFEVSTEDTRFPNTVLAVTDKGTDQLTGHVSDSPDADPVKSHPTFYRNFLSIGKDFLFPDASRKLKEIRIFIIDGSHVFMR